MLFCHLWILFFFLSQVFKISFRNTISVKQFGYRSGPTTFCQAWSGSRLLAELSAKVISRWQKRPLAGKELRIMHTLSGGGNSNLFVPFWKGVFSKKKVFFSQGEHSVGLMGMLKRKKTNVRFFFWSFYHSNSLQQHNWDCKEHRNTW